MQHNEETPPAPDPQVAAAAAADGPDLMQLARLGEIGAISELFDSGKYSIKYRDEEGITPLHWAAINNRYELCKFLLEAGADANAKGGESVATPAMWAAQRCHYYIVHLLLQYGADPLLTDIQGFNLLHLATIDGNAFLLVLLLHQEIPVDVADPQCHTGLMWAAYKGFPRCVDIFLKWGADVNATDDKGLTPLHWALVNGSIPCIQKLIEYGADRFAETADGKSPSVVANEMKTTTMWHRALRLSGYNPAGIRSNLPYGLESLIRTKRHMSKIYFLLPAIVLPVVFIIFSTLAIYIAVPVTLVFVFTVQLMLRWLTMQGPLEFRTVQRTASLRALSPSSRRPCVLQQNDTDLSADTYSTYFFSNLLFFVAFALTAYFWALCLIEDPGFVPKLASKNQQKAAITESIDSWRFDEAHFCVQYFAALPAIANQDCKILAASLCKIISKDNFTFVLTIWVSVQLVWVTMLSVVQVIQIARNQTTYENIKSHSHDHKHAGYEGDRPLDNFDGTRFQPSTLNPSLQAGQHPHPPSVSCFTKLKRLTGLDAFMVTAQDGFRDGHGLRRNRNPFSRGVIRNCQDFWGDPAPYFGRREAGNSMLGGQIVNYYRMYDIIDMPETTLGGTSSSRTAAYMPVSRTADADDGSV
ncbi:palmitoyltransferase akr1 [Myotisia sp. PD_48]|nr:palmitoyltransferase akr1 [Myotisia sp. PD_48]